MKTKYVLKNKRDWDILTKVERLEKMKLTKEDKFLIAFIKSQLEDDWRTPLLRVLNKLVKKYT